MQVNQKRRVTFDYVLLTDQAAQLIADARVACLKLAITLAEIAKIMMDEVILALMAERLSLSDIQGSVQEIYEARSAEVLYEPEKTCLRLKRDTSPLIECENGFPFVYAGSF